MRAPVNISDAATPSRTRAAPDGVSWRFRSQHPGGANLAFRDGSVHFVSQHMDHKTYQHLGCKNDGQALGNWQGTRPYRASANTAQLKMTTL